MKWLRTLFNCNKNQKMDTISFLLGSGFSKADGLPLVGEINNKLKNIDENEIFINSDRSAGFKEDKTPINHPNSKKNERKFVQEFLKFYCKDVISGESNFHYEDFFDFYNEFFKSYNDDAHPINLFCNDYRAKYMMGSEFDRDNINLIGDFHNTFNQLLAQCVQRDKYLEDVSHLNYPPYDYFIEFLQKLTPDNFIKVHTLNHDLLFERIGSVPPLWEEFSDGFSENNSPYYSEAEVIQNNIRKAYRVRLKSFQNKYDKRIWSSRGCKNSGIKSEHRNYLQ